ncbi:MAG TPA: hypothetical protein VFA20_03565 [Myxococcaceae bacterium]|nr:hypothetical protein [Myxococcaceae bacterium]
MVMALLSASGCGGSFDGHPGGLGMFVREAIFLSEGSAVDLLMDDHGGLCDAIFEGHVLPDATIFDVFFSDRATMDTLQPGSYPVEIGNTTDPRVIEDARILKTGANCREAQSVVAQGGGAMVTKFFPLPSSGVLRGSFDITFAPDGARATGTFDARFCQGSIGEWLRSTGCP